MRDVGLPARREASRVRVAVIGGGVTGLSAAHRLAELFGPKDLPLSLLLLESSARLGGQIHTERRGDYLLEGGPDTLVANKGAGMSLCERLGLGGEIVRLRYGHHGVQVLGRGHLARVPEGFMMMAPTRLGPVLRSSILSPWGKIRMVAERFVAPRAAAEGDESLASFVTRRFGREVFERLAEPIVANLYTADADRLSLGTTMPRFLEMERRHGSLSRALSQARRQHRPVSQGKHAVAYANAVYLRGGLGRIVEELGRRLPESCVCTAAAERLERVPGSGAWKIGVPGMPAIEAESVVLACPAYASASLLAGVDTAAGDALRQLRYASCATVNLVYRETDVRLPERSFGFFVPRTERCELLACSFVSRKFEGRVPRGQALLRVFLGGARHPDVADLGEEELGRRAHQELARLLSIGAEPLFRHVHRLSRAMPQYEVGYPAQIARVERRLQEFSGLFLAGTAVGAFGLPDCIESGERAAASAIEFLARRPVARSMALP